jgi:methionine synthase I (cobalamin-dependent)
MLADRADKAAAVKELTSKVEELTERQKTVAKKIAEAAGKTKVVTGKTGGSTSTDEDMFSGLTEDALNDLSDEQLDKLLEQEG